VRISGSIAGALSSLRPRKYPRPWEGEKGPVLRTPFFPLCRQLSQLLARCNSVACGAGAQLPIPTFGGSVAREGHDPIGRPIADVVGKRFNAAEFSLLKKPAQVTTHIRLGDTGRTPNLLANVVKALGASRLLAGKNDAAVFHRLYGAAPVLLDLRIDQLPEMRFDPSMGASSSAPIRRE
jgi:hypothetical protein